MHDHETEKPQKTGGKNKVWGGIALLILAIGVISFWCTMHKLPHAEWRNEFKPLSWEAAGVCIDHAEAYWKASAGDSRMELRAFCFPVCHLELDEAEGSGMVTVRFQNGQGVQMGDRINIPYKDGKFLPRESNSMHVTETEATVRLEDGFLSQDEYTLHQFNQDAPLWRVYVECRPQAGDLQPMGYLSIIPNDL
ncbi:MAG: hypothetical protein J6R92_06115 [Akkermansia sp.]|nr:hypothetical protein [Akkermansia sp.]